MSTKKWIIIDSNIDNNNLILRYNGKTTNLTLTIHDENEHKLHFILNGAVNARSYSRIANLPTRTEHFIHEEKDVMNIREINQEIDRWNNYAKLHIPYLYRENIQGINANNRVIVDHVFQFSTPTSSLDDEHLSGGQCRRHKTCRKRQRQRHLKLNRRKSKHKRRKS